MTLYISGFDFTDTRGSGSGTEENVLAERTDPNTGQRFMLVKYGAVVSAGVGVGIQVSGSNVVAKKAYDHQQTVGVTCAAASTGQFGWVQTFGKNKVALKTDGNAAAGSQLKNSAGTWVPLTTPTTSATAHLGYVISLDADASTALAAGDAFIRF